MPDIPNGSHTVDGRFADGPRHSEDGDVSGQALSVLSTKGLSRLLYQMGRTFDGLSSTRLSTQEFLETGNPRVLGSKSDLALLEDLRDAAQFTLHQDWASVNIDLAFVEAINASMTRTAAIEPGVLRTSANVAVATPLGDYVPPIPEPVRLESIIAQDTVIPDPLRASTRLFADLAKAQPFGDGNKRTALLAANALLLKRGVQGMVGVPTEDPDRSTFNQRLAAWYLHDDPGISDWLQTWNISHRDS